MLRNIKSVAVGNTFVGGTFTIEYTDCFLFVLYFKFSFHESAIHKRASETTDCIIGDQISWLSQGIRLF